MAVVLDETPTKARRSSPGELKRCLHPLRRGDLWDAREMSLADFSKAVPEIRGRYASHVETTKFELAFREVRR